MPLKMTTFDIEEVDPNEEIEEEFRKYQSNVSHEEYSNPPTSNEPYLDIRLTKDAMDHLWDIIDIAKKEEKDARISLAGNISKSIFVQDKNDWFFENVLKVPIDYLYYRDEWSTYYDVHIAKTMPPPELSLGKFWVNYQKQYEFNPPHNHAGLFSFVIFMKIPTHWKEQHALPITGNSNSPSASDFAFIMEQGPGPVRLLNIPLGSEDEGRMLLFPSWLVHQVYPFYGTEEDRITMSGNVNSFDNIKSPNQKKRILHDTKIEIDRMKAKVRSMEQMMEDDVEIHV